MKVIDLLNRIANGEEIPKKIRLGRYLILEYDGEEYIEQTNKKPFLYYIWNLNEKVEIIEENKNIDYVNTYVLCDSDFKEKGDFSFKSTEIIDKAFEEYSVAINKIIDKLNKMENKNE